MKWQPGIETLENLILEGVLETLKVFSYHRTNSALALGITPRTISRYIKALKLKGHEIPLRGPAKKRPIHRLIR